MDLIPTLAPVAASSEPTGSQRAQAAARALDALLHAGAARFTAGLSPASLTVAMVDWASHLATQPAQASLLAGRAFSEGLACLTQDPAARQDDPRFADPAWRSWPWSVLVNAHQSASAWWQDATALRGMAPHHREMMHFHARQWLDMLSPSNLGLASPEVLRHTFARAGTNLVDGAATVIDDWRASVRLAPTHELSRQYRPGIEVAVTPGKVVHRNALAELIQYQPQTPRVHAEPVFIVPSWIMKYYILDLSPHNSLVNWLVGQGHTVFILSWRNPDESDALLSLSDYLELGIFDCLAAIARQVPGQRVHAAGYCLGGTLLAMAAAAMARRDGIAWPQELAPLASTTLLAAETDFSEPGEMGVLIDESQVTLLEDMMAERGFLSGRQMAGSFAYLHSRDLVWSRRLRQIWLGESDQPNDLMAWNADTTRMPAVMHSEYLRRCFLRNELAQGRFPVQGRAVALTDIRLPMFVLATEKDHVSPWRSVYKIHGLCEAPITFALVSAGHNAGIVSEPGHPHRRFALSNRAADGNWQTPDAWLAQAARHEGSWWPAWSAWLIARGSSQQVPAREVDPQQALCDAPGDYVHVRYLD